MEVNGNQNCLDTKISSFCVPPKKESDLGSEQYEGEQMLTEQSFLGELSL